MSKALDITIAVEQTTPNIQLGLSTGKKDIQIGLEKKAIIYENDYERLIHHPQINSTTLIGNKTSSELGLQDELPLITRSEIREIINNL